MVNGDGQNNTTKINQMYKNKIIQVRNKNTTDFLVQDT